MDEIIIVVRKGLVESVYSKNKDIAVDLIDLDEGDDPALLDELKKQLEEIKSNKEYKRIFWASLRPFLFVRVFIIINIAIKNTDEGRLNFKKLKNLKRLFPRPLYSTTY